MIFKGLNIPPGRAEYDDANLSWLYTDVSGLILTSPENADVLRSRMERVVDRGEEWFKMVAWVGIPNTDPPERRMSLLTIRSRHLVGVGE